MSAFTVPLESIDVFGRGLRRPECVACTAAGAVWVSHALPGGGGGVARLDAGGVPQPIIARGEAPADLMPNGWSMEPGGSFLLANLASSGGVWRLAANGECTPVLLEVDGLALPPVNFVHRDERGRLWVSVSTWRVPRDRAFHRDVADGFVVLVDEAGARIVADGLGYSNEVKVDPSGRYLYANETIARRLSRFVIGARGLGVRETVVEYLDGVIPDGFEFDEEGAIWCASVMSNRLVRVAPDGSQTVLVEDCDGDAVAGAMQRWREGTFTREDMNIGAARKLANIASVAFGGSDRRTVYLGSLFGDGLFTFRSPVAGAAPPHWHF
ncbi:MAG: SMP-30/gluconolactonase/LRE family protein [Gammaproteobacteria bacterium]|nr:SMP-30/gluconolactonase/LRE family protein [Gammaproteobacteria bacterium]